MRRILIFLLLILSTSAIAQESQSDDAAAQAAAKNILQLFSDGKYNYVWNSMTSEWMRKIWTKDLFLSNFSIGRPKLGKLVSATFVSQNRLSVDPTTNFHGDFYVVTFRSKYAIGDFYEQVGVLKDPDGQFRFTGIDGSPVPPD